jgi:hypothetical protein
MEGSRRQFLGSVAALSATGAFLPSALGAETPEAGPEPVSVDWDFSWRERVRGPFRAVFDSPVVNYGVGLWRAADWKKTVQEVYNAKPRDVSSVLVIRHSAIPMIMNHAYWERHDIAAELKKAESSGNGSSRNESSDKESSGGESSAPPAPKHNPYMSREGDETKGREPTIDGFLASGGIVLACNYAFGFMVSKEARKAGIKQDEARAIVLQQVIPGVIIQPSGFFAVLEAQRSGCHFFPAAG